jgi:uncharacterized protein YqiB (DUF1249 family)
MLADSYIVPECVFGPGSFGGLMALYESNYIRLMQLLSSLDVDAEVALKSSSADDEDLFLSVEASSRYTQVLRLTYRFDEPGGIVADPDLCIRVYLDARMTQVVSWAEHHRHEVLRDLHHRVSRQVNQYWRRNMVFSKWLDFLLDKGHSFESANQCPESASRVAIVR